MSTKTFRLTQNDRAAFVDAIMADVPMPTQDAEARTMAQAIAYKDMPPEVRKVYDNEATRVYLNLTSIYTDGMNHRVYASRNFDPSREDQKALQALVDAWRRGVEARRHMRNTLIGAVARIGTYEKLVDWAGDKFAKYLRAIKMRDPVTNLPVSADFYTKLQELGFPQGSQPAPVADTKRARRVRKAAAKKAAQ